jgi:hypothetical protein
VLGTVFPKKNPPVGIKGGEQLDARLIGEGRALHHARGEFQQLVIIPWRTLPGFHLSMVSLLRRFRAVPSISITYRATYGTHMGTYTVKTLERGP